MEYTTEYLHLYLSKVCELDKQKLRYKVVQDLVFYCKVSDEEAQSIWNAAIRDGILTLINHWQHVAEFQYYKYHGTECEPLATVQTDDIDHTDKGMSTTYHNTKTPESLKYKRYAKDRTNTISKRKMMRV